LSTLVRGVYETAEIVVQEPTNNNHISLTVNKSCSNPQHVRMFHGMFPKLLSSLNVFYCI